MPLAVVLGVMQDAGLPQAGCRCPRCAAAYADPGRREFAASLAIVDTRVRPPLVWLIDATPDLKFQLHLLADVLGPDPRLPGRIRQPDGLLLTHGHMGHTAGLVHLGPEVMNVRDLPLHASPGLCAVLKETRLWQPLVANMILTPLRPGEPLLLGAGLSVSALPVPHRDEVGGGTYAFRIQGPSRSLLYLPDIDGWGQWPSARAAISTVEVALVDGTFYSLDELGGRPPVAHPLVPDTVSFWTGLSARLVLTHLNHTNPLLDEDSAARQAVASSGASVAYTGQISLCSCLWSCLRTRYAGLGPRLAARLVP